MGLLQLQKSWKKRKLPASKFNALMEEANGDIQKLEKLVARALRTGAERFVATAAARRKLKSAGEDDRQDDDSESDSASDDGDSSSSSDSASEDAKKKSKRSKSSKKSAAPKSSKNPKYKKTNKRKSGGTPTKPVPAKKEKAPDKGRHHLPPGGTYAAKAKEHRIKSRLKKEGTVRQNFQPKAGQLNDQEYAAAIFGLHLHEVKPALKLAKQQVKATQSDAERRRRNAAKGEQPEAQKILDDVLGGLQR